MEMLNNYKLNRKTSTIKTKSSGNCNSLQAMAHSLLAPQPSTTSNGLVRLHTDGLGFTLWRAQTEAFIKSKAMFQLMTGQMQNGVLNRQDPNFPGNNAAAQALAQKSWYKCEERVLSTISMEVNNILPNKVASLHVL